MTSTGESEMRRRRRFAEHIGAGPSHWQEATREAIIDGTALMDGFSPILMPTRYRWRWHVAAFLALCVALVLFVVPAIAQPSTSTETASGIGCNAAIVYDASTNGATQLVAAGTNGEAIYICGYTFFAGGTVNVSLVYGTGTNCATGQKKITPAYQFTAQTGISDNSPVFRGMAAPSGAALCINASAGQAVQAVVYYAKF